MKKRSFLHSRSALTLSVIANAMPPLPLTDFPVAGEDQAVSEVRPSGRTRCSKRAAAQNNVQQLFSISFYYRSTTLPTSAGDVGTAPSDTSSAARCTVKVTLRPDAKSGA